MIGSGGEGRARSCGWMWERACGRGPSTPNALICRAPDAVEIISSLLHPTSLDLRFQLGAHECSPSGVVCIWIVRSCPIGGSPGCGYPMLNFWKSLIRSLTWRMLVWSYFSRIGSADRGFPCAVDDDGRRP